MTEPSSSRGGTDDTTETGNNNNNNTNSNNNSVRNPNRWPFDIDLNFNPSWLVPQTGTGRQISPALNMLNDWMRAPYNFRRSNSENTDYRSNQNPFGGPPRTRSSNALGRGGGGGVPVVQENSTSSSENTVAAHSATVTQTMASAIQGYLLPNAGHRPRAAYQNINVDGNNQAGAANSESYVVDMEAGMNAWPSGSNVHHHPAPHSHHHHNHEPPTEEERQRRAAAGAESPRGEPETNTTTPAEIFRQSPEGQAIISVAERYSPFLLILLIKGLFDHGSGIVCFLALLLTFSHANSLFKKEVSKQGKRKLSYLLMITANLLVCMGLIFYVYQDEKLYLGLVFLPTNTHVSSMWTMFWVTGVIDFIAKFITIIVKIFVLILPARVSPYQKRGKYYLFVERTSQLYRTAIPMYSWVQYMSGTYEGPSTLVGGLLVVLYCALKLSDISKRYKAWCVALKKMLQQVHYGTTPTETELKEAGDVCPICHDSFHDPTKLNCSHIFCEECVTTWFDRERTCPMCRARVVDDPSYRDGQTTHFIQIF